MRTGEPYVAVESFRPHWDRIIASGRVTIDDHPSVARAMRFNTSERRETISLEICDKFLVDAGEPHILQILYLVTRAGRPWSKRKPRKPRRKKPIPNLLDTYKPKGKPRGIAFS